MEIPILISISSKILNISPLSLEKNTNKFQKITDKSTRRSANNLKKILKVFQVTKHICTKQIVKTTANVQCSWLKVCKGINLLQNCCGCRYNKLARLANFVAMFRDNRNFPGRSGWLQNSNETLVLLLENIQIVCCWNSPPPS